MPAPRDKLMPAPRARDPPLLVPAFPPSRKQAGRKKYLADRETTYCDTGTDWYSLCVCVCVRVGGWVGGWVWVWMKDDGLAKRPGQCLTGRIKHIWVNSKHDNGFHDLTELGPCFCSLGITFIGHFSGP